MVKEAKEKLARKRSAKTTLQLVSNEYEDELSGLRGNLEEKKKNLGKFYNH